ncbi:MULTISPECIES: hypothetical protein [Gordonia]|uniref:hypothetical protein n=1 Tax=Gordonia TaxID=2053 RepID=UPI0014316B8E|nr:MULTISPECIES: hypothetical protein [Gordonia]UPW09668.1 hypothetical protein M1C59_02040 [Gordonia terrae]
MTRTFETTTWGTTLHASGTDVVAGDLSLRAESLHRKIAFYLDTAGQPVCQSLCPTSVWFPTLVTRITSAVAAHGRVVVQVDAALPLHSAVLDVAFPGTHLAGATMADLTVVDLSRHRRTLHAEVPAHLTVTGTIALALSPVIPPRTSASRSVARTVTA